MNKNKYIIITSLFYEVFTIMFTVTCNNIQLMFIVVFHSHKYPMFTIYKLFHFHWHTYSHTQSWPILGIHSNLYFIVILLFSLPTKSDDVTTYIINIVASQKTTRFYKKQSNLQRYKLKLRAISMEENDGK